MLKQPEMELATPADEAMVLEIGIAKADGTGAMNNKGNHFLHFDKGRHSGALVDFAVLEFEVVSELVNEPMLIYFRSLN